MAAKPVAIDYTAYPHIFDRIIEHAPYEFLVLLRPTCKAIKDRVDSLLTAHVVLAPVAAIHGRPPQALAVGCPSGRLPSLMVWHCSPQLGLQDLSARVTDGDAELLRLLRHARVVDLALEGTSSRRAHAIARRLPAVDMVRFFHPHLRDLPDREARAFAAAQRSAWSRMSLPHRRVASPLPAAHGDDERDPASVVPPTTPGKQRTSVLFFDAQNTTFFPPPFLRSLAGGTTKFVMNINYDPRDYDLAARGKWVVEGIYANTVREAVFVLHADQLPLNMPLESPASDFSNGGSYESTPPTSWMLRYIVNHLAYFPILPNMRFAKHILVIDGELPPWAGEEREAVVRTLKYEMRQAMELVLSKIVGGSTGVQWMRTKLLSEIERMEVLRLDEYREREGRDGVLATEE